MQQKLSTEDIWSTSIQISAEDGTTPTIEIVKIDDEQYWKINGEVTNIKAEGKDGDTPVVEIVDGVWTIDGVSTGTNATGPAGKDGTDIEYVYYRSQSAVASWEGHQPNAEEQNGWKNSPLGITSTWKYEYMSVRTKPSGINQSWGTFSTPVIWSKWGEKGFDGDGVEYKYYLKNEEVEPEYKANDGNWKDEPQGVSINNKFEYVAVIKTAIDKETGESSVSTSVALWSKYSIDGTSPYLVILDNDSATIGTDSEGKEYDAETLQDVSTINVSVFEGDSNITDDCNFVWSVNGGTLGTNTGKSNYFTTLDENVNAATATVIVTKNSNPLGTKQFTISKNKQGIKGDSAATYQLALSPNSWNKNENASIVPTFTVTKYVGTNSSPAPTTEYEIRRAGDDASWIVDTEISETTIFELYIKNASGTFIKVDSETVSMVENGEDAIDYKIALTPTTVNLTTNPSQLITGQIFEIEGSTQRDITEESLEANKVFFKYSGSGDVNKEKWYLLDTNEASWLYPDCSNVTIAFCLNRINDDTRFPGRDASGGLFGTEDLPTAYNGIPYVYYYASVTAIKDGELKEKDIYIYLTTSVDKFAPNAILQDPATDGVKSG